MVLDECIEWPATRERVEASTQRTTRWLKRAIAARKKPGSTALFGIVQGGTFPELRAAHAAEIAELDLDGYAIGGLSVGEDAASRNTTIDAAIPGLPQDRPRYLMGVGQPIDIADAVIRGVDLFDCVLPTRAGRHAQAYTWEGRRNLRNASYAREDIPLDASCPCVACTRFSRGYLRHLVKAEELLAGRLLTEHNLTFYQQLMSRLRSAALSGDAASLDQVRLDALRASGQAGSVVSS